VTGELAVDGLVIGAGGTTHVMAVINLSPESRNAHSVAGSPPEALEMALRYRDLGATIFDLGGQSSHFENPTIDAAEEIARLVPAVELLRGAGLVVSIDTWKPEVASAAVAAGAQIVNDTGGMTDPAMQRLVAATGVAAVAVYVEGANPHAVAAVDTIAGKAGRTAEVFSHRLRALEAAGVRRVLIDPGIALNYRGDYEAYTRTQLEVIRESAVLHDLGVPVLIPIPRKKEVQRVMAYVTLALEYGADVIRVHDVAEACDLVALFDRTAGG
jgi:dihydropteroate synthase